MSTPEKEMSSVIEQMIQTSLAAQALRISNQWEPRISGVLTNAAHALARRLGPVFAQMGAAPADPGRRAQLAAALPGLIAEVASQQAERAVEVLMDMVSQEMREILEAATINGLTMDIPRLDLREMDDRELARALAGGQALSESVAKSAAELTDRLLALLADSEEPAAEQASLPEGLDQALKWWRARLGSMASTVTHAVFNRAKTAAVEALA